MRWTCLVLICALAFPLHAQEHPLTRIALGSCAHQTYPQPIWNAVLDWNPQLFLFLGDAVYADTRDMDSMRVCYNQMDQVPGYQRLKAACPILAIWDDHDYGENDGGATYPKRDEAQQIFLDFFQEPPASNRRHTPGIYDVQLYGPPDHRIQIILLDTRYFRSDWTEDKITKKRYRPNYNSNQTMLGEPQWTWLEGQLQQPAQIRIICSGVQIINDEHGYECWGNLPLERDRLFKLIRKTNASGVLFLSGDRHFSELSVMDGGVGYPLYDFTSSGLTHSAIDGIKFSNSHRVGTAYGDHSFGTLAIDWDTPDPALTVSAHDVNGNIQFTHQIKLSELQPE